MGILTRGDLRSDRILHYVDLKTHKLLWRKGLRGFTPSKPSDSVSPCAQTWPATDPRPSPGSPRESPWKAPGNPTGTALVALPPLAFIALLDTLPSPLDAIHYTERVVSVCAATGYDATRNARPHRAQRNARASTPARPRKPSKPRTPRPGGRGDRAPVYPHSAPRPSFPKIFKI